MAKAKKKAAVDKYNKALTDKEKSAKKKYPIKFIYHGRTVIINVNRGKYLLTIDKEKIPILQNGKTGFIAMPHAPMVYHQNIEELAKFVTDQVINMRCEFPYFPISIPH